MPTNKSSTSGSQSAPGAAVSSAPQASAVPMPAGGTTGGANGVGIGPATVTRPPNGFQTTVQQILNGVSKDIPSGSSITVAGQSLTQAQILGALQPVLDGFTAITNAETAVKQQRLSLSALLPQARTLVDNLKVALIAQFGKGSPLLQDFGIKDGTNKKQPTAAAKAAAQVKSKATRELRNTMGKVEKAKVKFQGQVSAPSVVSASAPAGSTGSAPSGGSGNGAA